MDDARRERMEILKKRMDNKDVKINPMEMLRLNESQRNEFQKIQKKYREFFNNSKNSLKKKHLELYQLQFLKFHQIGYLFLID